MAWPNLRKFWKIKSPIGIIGFYVLLMGKKPLVNSSVFFLISRTLCLICCIHLSGESGDFQNEVLFAINFGTTKRFSSLCSSVKVHQRQNSLCVGGQFLVESRVLRIFSDVGKPLQVCFAHRTKQLLQKSFPWSFQEHYPLSSVPNCANLRYCLKMGVKSVYNQCQCEVCIYILPKNRGEVVF